MAGESVIPYKSISLIKLICGPELFDGDQVLVSGIFKFNEEELAIFIDYASYKQVAPTNSIPLEMKMNASDFKLFDGERIQVLGEYKMHNQSVDP